MTALEMVGTFTSSKNILAYFMQSVERTYLTTCSTDHLAGLAGRSGDRPFTQPGSDMLVTTSTQSGFELMGRCPMGESGVFDMEGYGEYLDEE